MISSLVFMYTERGEARLFLGFLGMVRDALPQRGQAQQDRVPLVRSIVTKLPVRPVKPVQHSQHSVALIEPADKQLDLETTFHTLPVASSQL